MQFATKYHISWANRRGFFFQTDLTDPDTTCRTGLDLRACFDINNSILQLNYTPGFGRMDS